MKKIIYTIICSIIMVAVFTNLTNAQNTTSKSAKLNEETNIQESIEKKIIRFHCIANSDAAEDQALKLKVRDAVLQYIQPKLKESKSINESRNILKNSDSQIKKIALKVIKDNGYKYGVVTMLSHENFPVKTYGNITLPQGEYEAYRIIIGSGKGKNWWCVMFPPLCFVDITKGEVSYSKTEAAMKKVLNEKEYELVDNTKDEETSSKDQIEVKFKIVELIHNLFNK